MSLGIAITTSEGITLAADSRQSYQNRKGAWRVGSDAAQKVFSLTDRTGVIVAGVAFLDDHGVNKNISKFIDDFKRIHELKKLTVEQTANQLHSFFEGIFPYKEQLKELPKQLEAQLKVQGMSLLEHRTENGNILFKFKDQAGQVQQGMAGIQGLHFLVAGFNSDGSYMVCNVDVPGTVRVARDSKVKGREYGADWIGQTDVLTRIVLGFDHRIKNLPFVQKAMQEVSEDAVAGQLRGVEYVIAWGTMTLQDAVDFSRLAIETTTSIQRFSDGIQMDPGDVPGVGGAVDVACIIPEPPKEAEHFRWLREKQLDVER